ncbi:Hypothetical predicted protein [Paramuricea clavata]|uniref:Reverse transcriptase domain-containing protein n=1 Tax=Paramuricea clavata TaxID=317549 RepID=A0A7D9JHC1_PARCT|nr:Hypothetical predicted protein [Paramuricea clavata]
MIPAKRANLRPQKTTIKVRDKRPSNVASLGRFLLNIPWENILSSLRYSDDKLTTFTEIINYGLNTIMPERSIEVSPNDRPWMTSHLKRLILQRQKAFALGNNFMFKLLRNKVNRERKRCRAISVFKASGPDELPNWVLKSFSDILAPAITDIFNASFRKCKPTVVNWIADFLRGRTQRVKINSVYSNFLQVPAGIPQGTKIGPWLFLAIINYLCITKSPTSNLWKFADDTSVSEVIPKDGVSSLPDKVDEVNKWSNDNKFQLNPGKCKELRINFTTQPFTEVPLNINGKPFEIVKSAKVLGMIVTNDLKWNKHKTATYLQEPLVETGLPPHFSMAIDKSTPHRDIDQAIILIIPSNGKRVAVPVDAPIVYHVSPDSGNVQSGNHDELAQQVVTVLSE